MTNADTTKTNHYFRALTVLVTLAVMASSLVSTAKPAQAAFPGANGRIAFTSGRDGNFEVYTMNPDGTDQKRLTIDPSASSFIFDVEPAVSPDGKQIAFTSNRDGNFRIYTMDADGSNQKRVTNIDESESHPTWSPDGKKIAFTRRGASDTDIAVVSIDSGGSDLNPIAFGLGDETEPAFAVDGRIAYVDDSDGDREIYTMNADGSNKKQLTKNNAFEGDPSWSPNGKKIVFESQRNPGNSEIFKMNADGSKQKRLTKNGVPDGSPAFSPDGKKIAFASNATIREMNADGSKQKTITSGGNSDPDWGVAATI